MYCRILSNWALSTCGPCSVSGSNGSPSLRSLFLSSSRSTNFVVNLLLDEQPAAGAAALALVEVQAEVGAGDGRIEIGIGEDRRSGSCRPART